MSLRINDIAPDFTAETTHGTIQFHEWIGDNWAVLFSHPRISPLSAPLSWAPSRHSMSSSRRGAPK